MTLATLTFEMKGVFPMLMRPWLARVTRRFLALEAAGLKACSEAIAASPVAISRDA